MRDWLHVDDTCAALDCILHGDLAPLRGEVINIGSGESLSIADIARMVVQVMGASRSLITYVGERPGRSFATRRIARKPHASSAGRLA